MRNIDVDSLREATVVFEGNARDAANQFPKNLNVAATLSLLGIGFEATRVTIICDPNAETNSHTLVVKGDFGELHCETQNVPSPMTPSTSYLAALSAIAAIKRILGNVWIGV
jgi:aspartate dehydrogenase